MARKRKKGARSRDAVLEKVIEMLAEISDFRWLNTDGSPFSGVVVDPENPQARPKPTAPVLMGVQAADKDDRIVRIEVDNLGVMIAIPENNPPRRLPRRLSSKPVCSPTGLIDACRGVVGEVIDGGGASRDRLALRTLDEAGSRLWRDGYKAISALTKPGAKPRAHDPATLFDAMGRTYAGPTELVAGRHYSLESRQEDGATVAVSYPLFFQEEVWSARTAARADQLIIHNDQARIAAHRLTGKAWNERMRLERPGVLTYLEDYNGESAFLKAVASRVRRGYALSDAQVAAVENVMARHAAEDRAAGRLQPSASSRDLRIVPSSVDEFLRQYRGPSPFLNQMAGRIRESAALTAAQLEAVEQAMDGYQQKQIEGAAWLARMREERPDVIRFLESYEGQSSFLQSVAGWVKAGLPLSDAQVDGVEDAMIRHNIIPSHRQDARMRVRATVVSCESYEAPVHGFPRRTVTKQRAVLQAEDGRRLVAKATAFSGAPGERVYLSLTKTGENRDGDEPEIHVSRLFRLDDDGKVIKGARAKPSRKRARS